MNPILDAASLSSQSSYWIALLFDLSIKGAIVLALAALSAFALRRASAAVRHMVWNLALVGLLALPAFSLILPAWNVPVLPRLHAAPQTQTYDDPTVAAAAASEYAAQTAIEDAERRALAGAQSTLSTDTTRSTTSESGVALASPAAVVHWSIWLLILWLGGAVLVAARLGAGIASVWWITRQARPVEDPMWTGLSEFLSWQLGLTRRVVLLESERVSMPLTWGLFRPVILLPADTRSWSEERRHIVLSHELAHVKRRDCLTQTLAQAACAFYWFNPLVWIAARQLRMERERACDDHVLHSGTRASDYASHLLEIARSIRSAGCTSMTAVAIARRSQLEGRLLAILDPDLSRRGLNRAGATFALIATFCVVLPIAAMRPLASDDLPNTDRSKQEAAISETSSDLASSRAENKSRDMREAITLSELSDKVDDTQGKDSSSETEPADTPEATSQADDPNEEAVRDSIKESVAQASENQAVEALKTALRDVDWEVRKQAAWSLGLKGDHTSVDSLIEALKDEHPEVREQAAWALGLKGDSRAVRPLTVALRDSHPSVREQAAWALGLKGNGEAVEPLTEALKDEHDQVRKQAAWALGLKGDSRAVEPLMAALRDSAHGVREQAAWALGLKGDGRALPLLKEALKDSSGQVREQARWAIGMILIRGGRGDSKDNDGDMEFEFDVEDLSKRVGEAVSNKLGGRSPIIVPNINTNININPNINVNPNPSPRGNRRNNN